MKPREMRRLLKRLGYVEDTSTGGSHRNLTAPGRPRLTFAFHASDEIEPTLVWNILIKQDGLTYDEARRILRRRNARSM